MQHNPEIRASAIADDWAIRAEFWNSEFGKSNIKRRKRERNSTPLILTGHGASLKIENGALAIRDGFTHYPQQQATYRYFPGNPELPQRIVLLDGSGSLTFEVLSWLGEQQIALARIKWGGEIAIVASGSGFAGDRAKVDWQIETKSNEAARLAFSIGLIRAKAERSVRTLQECFVPTPKRDRAILKIQSGLGELKSAKISEIVQLRALEAICAAAYFGVWKEFALKWIATNRRPIPQDWTSYSGRSSIANGTKQKNVNASHPINAILNYAYTVRQAKLQIDAIAEGYDPTIGIMHHGRRGAPAYIFDLIEPERPLVDAAMLNFMQSRQFSASDFLIRTDGVCRLSPSLAKAVARTLS